MVTYDFFTYEKHTIGGFPFSSDTFIIFLHTMICYKKIERVEKGTGKRCAGTVEGVYTSQ